MFGLKVIKMCGYIKIRLIDGNDLWWLKIVFVLIIKFYFLELLSFN